ncbi:hypothetical protein SLEP1_g30968 [Rubroshorea leprosula]|uniref:Uncharacterized protein n=1 Tax=Rubroshorea leprosula TaxID=152421 RepID=A0AAV5K754_9ROSI|nr:hypothetical protein SLEP1_g30968 [Rubroshorea leprosula]
MLRVSRVALCSILAVGQSDRKRRNQQGLMLPRSRKS